MHTHAEVAKAVAGEGGGGGIDTGRKQTNTTDDERRMTTNKSFIGEGGQYDIDLSG